MKTLNVIAWSVIGALSVGVICREAIAILTPDVESKELDGFDLLEQEDLESRITFQAKFELLQELRKTNKITTETHQEKFSELQIEFFGEPF